ncbi:MAG: hypothetical protein IT319_16535 [Anaerolineae bacterium]|nr:hypothetical protein [Anaerolineae bacterium]
MMEKPKRDPVVPAMRERLLANRDGRLTPEQWGDLIAQPLVVLILLGGMGLAAFGPRLVALLRFWWIIVPLILLLVIGPVILRAFRYARAPVHFARLYAGVQAWGFRKPQVFYTVDDEPVAFQKRLAPKLPLRIDGEYLIYYLDEPQGKVLLSLAPADHEDAEHWLPTKGFAIRHERRSGHG